MVVKSCPAAWATLESNFLSMLATINTPMVRNATDNHLMNSTFLEKVNALSLVSATLEIKYATQFFSAA